MSKQAQLTIIVPMTLLKDGLSEITFWHDSSWTAEAHRRVTKAKTYMCAWLVAARVSLKLDSGDQNNQSNEFAR